MEDTNLREKEFGFCRKCSKKVLVVEPSLLPIQTRRGLHIFITGKCSECDFPLKSIRGKPE